MKKTNASIRKASFFGQLQLSETTVSNYRAALNSSFLKEVLRSEYEVLDIFEIVDVEVLWKLYSNINLHPKNINNHRAYSSAIMKYIRFLNNGKKIGKRIDYKRRRIKM